MNSAQLRRGSLVALAGVLAAVIGAFGYRWLHNGAHTPLARAATPSTTSQPQSSRAGTPSSVAPVDLHAVDWPSSTIPGSLCLSPKPIRLHDSTATNVPSDFDGPEENMSQDVAAYAEKIAYGDITGDGHDEAALPILCANHNSTAARLIVLLIGGGLTATFIVRQRLVEPGHGGRSRASGSVRPRAAARAVARPGGVDPAIAAALERRQRRAEARRILEQDPALARELRIGRPDLPGSSMTAVWSTLTTCVHRPAPACSAASSARETVGQYLLLGGKRIALAWPLRTRDSLTKTSCLPLITAPAHPERLPSLGAPPRGRRAVMAPRCCCTEDGARLQYGRQAPR